jgi:putative colanic acid biosynthesis acetyltransferase WcaF
MTRSTPLDAAPPVEHAANLPDSRANRAARKYSAREQFARVLWSVLSWSYRFSPRPCFAWRRALLRLFGARVGQQVHVYPSTRFYMPWNVSLGDYSAIGEDVLVYSLGPVAIGAHATVSYRAHVCAGTHDFSDPATPLLKPAVTIGDGAWIGTDAFIGPGVSVGATALVGARAVVVGDVAPGDIVAGHPARVIGRRGT